MTDTTVIAATPTARTTEERAARLLGIYRAELALHGLPPDVSPDPVPVWAIHAARYFLSLGMPADWDGLEDLPEVAAAMAVLEASGPSLGTDAAERASLTALAHTS